MNKLLREGILLEGYLLGLIPDLFDIENIWIWSRQSRVVVLFILIVNKVGVRVGD